MRATFHVWSIVNLNRVNIKKELKGSGLDWLKVSVRQCFVDKELVLFLNTAGTGGPSYSYSPQC